MQYVIAPYSYSFLENGFFAWWDNGFTDEELDDLQLLALKSDERAKVGQTDNGAVVMETRRTYLNWIHFSSETEWVYKKLSHIVSSLNSQYFRFDLTGFGEPIQLTNYKSDEKGMYGWHIDGGTKGISRKLSLVLQLTDPSEYEGGFLEVKSFNNQPIQIERKRGLITLFPSFLLHQVTPVTSGSRQSLVSWITGPAFR